ncbi:MAG: ATP phosphoribosyltransferase regulatory subunit [Clostridia bacterium]|nr:ATP phosphoribosyltransferase regulatory subunit [Clostridia bacterium]
MNFDNILRNDEKSVYNMRALFEQYGYKQFRMSKFEEYDVYVRNKDFLVSDSIITFTGANGKLMALKPDVTFSIIKNTDDSSDTVTKLYYNENVYRTGKGSRDFKEIMQTGLECIGEIDTYNICEVLMLAAQSLAITGERFILDVSHMGFIAALLEHLGVDDDKRSDVLNCIREKNTHGIYAVLGDDGECIVQMINAYGDFDTVLSKLRDINVNDATNKVICELEEIKNALKDTDNFDKIHLDFSVVNDLNYYNGIVFQGFIADVPSMVLSGGQYDKLMHKMGKNASAIGFAVYHDMLKQLNSTTKQYDADVLITYGSSTDLAKLSAKVRELTNSGMTVMVQKNIPHNIKYKLHMDFDKEGVQ